jgi:hypothetical protein
MIRAPATGLRGASPPLRFLPSPRASEHPEQLLEPAVERRVQAHLHTEVLERGNAVRSSDAARGSAKQVFVHTADLRELGDGNAAQHLEHRLDLVHMIVNPISGDQFLLRDHAAHGGETPRIGSWLDLEMEVGEIGGLRTSRIDDDHRTRRILGDLLERRSRTRHRM